MSTIEIIEVMERFDSPASQTSGAASRSPPDDFSNSCATLMGSRRHTYAGASFLNSRTRYKGKSDFLAGECELGQTVEPPSIDANLGPDAFRRAAGDFYSAFKGLNLGGRFSPVNYFLLTRAMELAIKAHFLEGRAFDQDYLKKTFLHRVSDAYDQLPASKQVLDPNEKSLLSKVSDLYAEKAFEYFNPKDALTGYSRYPPLDAVEALTKKVLAI